LDHLLSIDPIGWFRFVEMDLAEGFGLSAPITNLRVGRLGFFLLSVGFGREVVHVILVDTKTLSELAPRRVSSRTGLATRLFIARDTMRCKRFVGCLVTD